MALRVRWADYLGGMNGTISKEKYVRRIPGNTEWALLCDRPQYNKSEKKDMAQRETVKNFKELQALASREYKEHRAEWETRWKAALRAEQKHPHLSDSKGRTRVPPVLWQYVKREVYRTGNGIGTAKE